MDINYLFNITVALTIIAIIIGIAVILNYQRERINWDEREKRDLKNQRIFNIIFMVGFLYLFLTTKILLLIFFIGINLIINALIFWNSQFAFFNYVPFKSTSLSKFGHIISLLLGIGISLFGISLLLGLIKQNIYEERHQIFSFVCLLNYYCRSNNFGVFLSKIFYRLIKNSSSLVSRYSLFHCFNNQLYSFLDCKKDEFNESKGAWNFYPRYLASLASHFGKIVYSLTSLIKVQCGISLYFLKLYEFLAEFFQYCNTTAIRKLPLVWSGCWFLLLSFSLHFFTRTVQQGPLYQFTSFPSFAFNSRVCHSYQASIINPSSVIDKIFLLFYWRITVIFFAILLSEQLGNWISRTNLIVFIGNLNRAF